ncbi:MAG: hypothetical protein ABI885_04590 [Gammaproteobacteria bacterium]
MSEKDDLEWLDALAGRKQNSPAAAEGREFRAAFLERTQPSAPEVPEQDAVREMDLIVRAAREGLLPDTSQLKETLVIRLEGHAVDVGDLQDNPFAQRFSWRCAFRGSGARAMGAAVLACAVLALGWHMRPTAAPEEVFRASPAGVVRIQAADPRALKKQIIEELQAAGVHAQGYQQLGADGIDADLPQPLSQEVHSVLQRHGIPVPRDGVLRVEFAAPGGH